MRVKQILWFHGVCLSLLGLFFTGGCGGTPPRNPPAEGVTWKVYSNAVVGYTLEYPEVYEPQEHHEGRDVLFRYDGYPVISISHVDEEEGRNRGLWVGRQPLERIWLAEREGDQYHYRHYDGPFYMRTVSYVVPHQGKSLGLEFRTHQTEPDGVQRHILRSFRFVDSIASVP